MSNKRTHDQNGGSAFPVIPPDTHGYQSWYPESGMSLRDYFAANVITALYPDRIDRIAAPDEPMNDEVDDANQYIVPGEVLAQRIAKAAYMVADAMLKEREK